MSTKMKAIGAYCPRVQLERMVDAEDIAEHLAMRTGLLEAQIYHVLIELRETVRHFTLRGHSVRLDGLGIYSPGVELDGTITIHHRADRYLIKELNKEGAFRGIITHRENIGKTGVELVALWDEEHPTDPITG
jgi:hypothetical protein